MRSRLDAWVETKVDALVLAAHAAYENDGAEQRYERVVKGTAETIRECRLSDDQNFVSHYREFVGYVEAADIAQLRDHELGFRVPDKQYFEETRQYVQVPEFLLAQNFLRSVGRYETLNEAKSFLRELNSKRDAGDQLIFFSYRSQHLGTPDNDDSYERLLIVVPGKEGVPEKWVQFGVTDRGARIHIRNLSVVSTMPGPNGTSNVYFKDFYRTYRRDEPITIKGRWELGYGDDNCVRCHKSGILPVFPEPGSVSAGEQQALLAVNQRFLAYGPPRFQNYLDASKFGPGLSAADEEDRTRRFGANFANSIVGRAMVCAACHKPERLGAFNWPMDSVLISSYIEGGQMPIGLKLKTSERKELYAKLIQEYFAVNDANPGIFQGWLLGKQGSRVGDGR